MVATIKLGPQDLPPEGGYSPIQTERIKLRRVIGGRLGIALFYTVSIGASYLYYLNLRDVRRSEIEMRSSRLAIYPLLEAERDRALLKHMRRLRDEEADLMKNYPNWEVGTFFGEPVFYKDRPECFEPRFFDTVVFSNPKDYSKRAYRHWYT
ncbi:NADH dehydrogenase [ubiquinone] 1 alpha subcomplex subunit 13 [Osmia bicornis bicornis]|uniref:NADH dehydrogenase [ubiquinone] 1 alpha subcomplex subunit 13 n=1 Tax=Osmia bicornis bicornis TaxID=1437191 RepID=UPI0010F45D12|nr:NADH dehydrogenase [ubiquinone] 1 alpha subcomplex subunit 13 [Osmia bicornis bicornis]